MIAHDRRGPYYGMKKIFKTVVLGPCLRRHDPVIYSCLPMKIMASSQKKKRSCYWVAASRPLDVMLGPCPGGHDPMICPKYKENLSKIRNFIHLTDFV